MSLIQIFLFSYKGNHDDFVSSRVFNFTKSPQSKQMRSLRENRNAQKILLAIFIPEIDPYYFWMPVLMPVFFSSFVASCT